MSFFFLHDLTDGRLLLALELNNLNRFFFFIENLNLFHLNRVLYGFSLTYLNLQHHLSCALETLLRKQWLFVRKHCDTVTVDLMTKTAPK